MRGLDWRASDYDRVATPQLRWGLALLDSRRWSGDERVLDAGGGTGRLGAEILRRIPRGTLMLVDLDPGMLAAARSRLAGEEERVRFEQVDLGAMPRIGPFDLVVSNAVFHWVLDHDALFAGLHRVLVPGGELLAQCGGAGNIARVHEVARQIAGSSEFAERFQDWHPPWRFETAEASRARLVRAGFVDVETWLEDAPVPFADRVAAARFLREAPLVPFLTRIGDPGQQDRFVEGFLDRWERDVGPWVLDYVRLTMRARRTMGYPTETST